MSTQGSRPSEKKVVAAKIFDVRLLIGGLFVLYGVVLTIAGFFASTADRHKASDININLWMGIGMLALSALFLLWCYLRPLRPPSDVSNDL